MKFENPIMNISMFEVENVVTDPSANVNAAFDKAEELATAATLGGNQAVPVRVVF